MYTAARQSVIVSPCETHALCVCVREVQVQVTHDTGSHLNTHTQAHAHILRQEPGQKQELPERKWYKLQAISV